MSKVYAFIIIIPVLAVLFFKTIAFYEFDTKQRYVKNIVDATAHKVMITGVMTVKDKEELLQGLKNIGEFSDEDIYLNYGNIKSDGELQALNTYTLGNILIRGEVFSIYVQSKNGNNLFSVEGYDDKKSLYYKAKAVCRIEKNQQREGTRSF